MFRWLLKGVSDLGSLVVKEKPSKSRHQNPIVFVRSCMRSSKPCNVSWCCDVASLWSHTKKQTLSVHIEVILHHLNSTFACFHCSAAKDTCSETVQSLPAEAVNSSNKSGPTTTTTTTTTTTPSKTAHRKTPRFLATQLDEKPLPARTYARSLQRGNQRKSPAENKLTFKKQKTKEDYVYSPGN